MDNVHSLHGEKLETRNPLFNGELREKVTAVVGGEPEVVNLETVICNHIVLKLREFGTHLGTQFANFITSKIG